jgi:hypothetical protein
MATVKELEEYYSVEDALNMYEIIIIDNFNESEAMRDGNGS